MKTAVRITAAVLVLVMMVGMLASCAALSGKYEGLLFSIEFNGNKYEMTGNITGETYSAGTYKIEDDQITFTHETGEKGDDYSGTFSFEQDEDTITIGKFGKFTKK